MNVGRDVGDVVVVEVTTVSSRRSPTGGWSVVTRVAVVLSECEDIRAVVAGVSVIVTSAGPPLVVPSAEDVVVVWTGNAVLVAMNAPLVLVVRGVGAAGVALSAAVGGVAGCTVEGMTVPATVALEDPVKAVASVRAKSCPNSVSRNSAGKRVVVVGSSVRCVARGVPVSDVVAEGAVMFRSARVNMGAAVGDAVAGPGVHAGGVDGPGVVTGFVVGGSVSTAELVVAAGNSLPNSHGRKNDSNVSYDTEVALRGGALVVPIVGAVVGAAVVASVVVTAVEPSRPLSTT